MTSPRVSVVITAYNRPEFLKGAIESVMAQTFRDFELIIIDDCSPTELFSIVQQFGAGVRFHRQEQNGQLSHARNTGVRLARGEYIAFLDDDDEWLPTKLEQQMEAVRGYDACLCGFEDMETGEATVHPVHEVTPEMLLYRNKFGGPTGLLCKRSILLDEIFDVQLPLGSDWDMYIRLARQRPMAYVPEPLFLRRTSDPVSMTNKKRTAELYDTLIYARPVFKHRNWLGERVFRRNLARSIMVNIKVRPRKWTILLAAATRAGVGPTMWYVWYKMIGGDKRLWPDPQWRREQKGGAMLPVLGDHH